MDTIPTKKAIRSALLKGVIYGLAVAAVVAYQHRDWFSHTNRISGLTFFHDWLSATLLFTAASLMFGGKVKGFRGQLRALSLFLAPTIAVLLAISLWPLLWKCIPMTPFLDCYFFAWGLVNLLRWRSWIIGKPVVLVETVPTARYSFSLSAPTISETAERRTAASQSLPAPSIPVPLTATATPTTAPDALVKQHRG